MFFPKSLLLWPLMTVLRIFLSISSSACLSGVMPPRDGQASWLLPKSFPHFLHYSQHLRAMSFKGSPPLQPAGGCTHHDNSIVCY